MKAAVSESIRDNSIATKNQSTAKNSGSVFKISHIALCLALIALILLARLWHIADLDELIVWDDELGYWTHAANLAGLPWYGVIGTWYSYGYSLLLLPLFFISHDMATMYQMAIVVNAILGVASFFMGLYILRRLHPRISLTAAMLMSFVAAMYSAYIFQSQIAWSETFLYTWFLLVVCLCIRLGENCNLCNTTLLTLSVAFLYIIHNRAICIWIALVLTLLYLCLLDKKRWKYLLVSLAMLALVYAANIQVKQYLYTFYTTPVEIETVESETVEVDTAESETAAVADTTAPATTAADVSSSDDTTMSTSSSTDVTDTVDDATSTVAASSTVASTDTVDDATSTATDATTTPASASATTDTTTSSSSLTTTTFDGNDISSVLARVKKYINAAGMGIFIQSFIGKVWYLLTATLVLAAFGIADLCQRKSHPVSVFVLLSILGTLGVAALVLPKSSLSRGDFLIYGRYSDMVAGLLILLGLAYLYQATISQQHGLIALLCLGLYGICTLRMWGYQEMFLNASFNVNCIPGVYFASYISIKRLACITLAVGVCLALVPLFYKKKNIAITLACLGLTVLFYHNGEMAYAQGIATQHGIYDKLADVQSLLLQYEDTLIYNAISDQRYRKNLRTVLADAQMVLVDTEDDIAAQISTSQDHILILDGESFFTTHLLEEGYQRVLSSGGLCVLVKGDTITAQMEAAGILSQATAPQLTYHMAETDFAYSGFGEIENDSCAWVVNEKASILCQLDSVDYTVTLTQGWEVELEKLGLTSYQFDVYVDDVYLTTLTIDEGNNGGTITFDLPQTYLLTPEGTNSHIITFVCPLWDPADFGSTDTRSLGFSLESLVFEAE